MLPQKIIEFEDHEETRAWPQCGRRIVLPTQGRGKKGTAVAFQQKKTFKKNDGGCHGDLLVRDNIEFCG